MKFLRTLGVTCLVLLASAHASATEVEVIFQGLIGYTKSVTDRGTTVKAYLVDARKMPPPDEAFLPVILDEDAVDENGLHFPSHAPFLAVENGKINDSANCFVDTKNSRTFNLRWENGGNGLSLQAYPLCRDHFCGELALNLDPPTSPTVDLDSLVSRDDLESGTTCANSFLKLTVTNRTTAQVVIKQGLTVVSQALESTPCFAFMKLSSKKEGVCATQPDTKFAEQVLVRGIGPLSLADSRGNRCTFAATPEDKPLRVWIFNVHEESYTTAPTRSHHEAFYWYYDLAPTPCSGGSTMPSYTRVCPTGSACGIFGDPKCPQVLYDGP